LADSFAIAGRHVPSRNEVDVAPGTRLNLATLLAFGWLVASGVGMSVHCAAGIGTHRGLNELKWEDQLPSLPLTR
jgi:hypothetical protein